MSIQCRTETKAKNKKSQKGPIFFIHRAPLVYTAETIVEWILNFPQAAPTHEVVFPVVTDLLNRGCTSIQITLEAKDLSTDTSPLFVRRMLEKFSDQIHVQIVKDSKPYTKGATITFFNTKHLANPSEYKGATYTIQL